eukprot:maker-scaffold_7-snap-gene-19.84-mRNA-1 protein AED:0.14 eAED:0.14 QI:60/0.5/0.33/1/0/0/3/0/239
MHSSNEDHETTPDGFFSPGLFTTDIKEDLEKIEFVDEITSNRISLKVSCVHDENQYIEEFVSRVVWPSAVAVAQYFFENPLIVEDKAVLELGSGTGLTGFMISKLGAKLTVLTDCCKKSLDVIETGVQQNILFSCVAEKLFWGNDVDISTLASKHGKFDHCVAADVVYEPKFIEPLFKTAFALLKHPHSKFYIANHCSRYAKFEEDVSEIEELLGLTKQKIKLDESKEYNKGIMFYNVI